MEIIMSILSSWGIPTALTGLFFWKLQRDLTKKEKAREERERNREKLDMVILKSTTASLALGEATAKAVQRIPDAHCNGDMHSALDYATKVKNEQKDFLTSLGIHALHEE